jgi:hypothetical protein
MACPREVIANAAAVGMSISAAADGTCMFDSWLPRPVTFQNEASRSVDDGWQPQHIYLNLL